MTAAVFLCFSFYGPFFLYAKWLAQMLHACQTTSHYRVAFESVRACMEKRVTQSVFCGGLSSGFKKER